MSTFLTVPEAADIVRKSQRFIRSELGAKNLAGHKIGAEWRIAPADLDAYIAATRNVTPVRRRAS